MKRITYALIFFWLVINAGCSLSRSSAADHIFLITLDTTRADCINYSPGNNRHTPNLAALASRGIYFKNAYALTPVTLPSHYSMLYSLPPHLLKIYNNGQVRQVSHPALPQLMKKKDYRTGAVVSLGVLKSDFGLNKGFDEYIENFKSYLWYKTAEEVNRDAFGLLAKIKGKKSFTWLHYSDPHEPYYPPIYKGNFRVYFNGSPVFTSKSIEQPLVSLNLELKPGENLMDLKTEIPPAIRKSRQVAIRFMTYQDFEVTGPKVPEAVEVVVPRRWQKAKVKGKTNYFARAKDSSVILLNKEKENLPINLSFVFRMLEHPNSRKYLYRHQVRYMDRQIGKLIEFLKARQMYDNSLFIIMGDHGEGLGEYRQHFGHIHYLNKIYSHVPLIIAGVGVKQRGAREEPVTTLDIAPTILHLAGIRKPDFMQGRSLDKPLSPNKIILETYAPEAYFDSFSVVDFPYQIIFCPGRKKDRIELIDLQNDRFGIRNIFHTTKNLQIKSDLYNSVLKISRVLTAQKGKVGKISERHREILKSLGYL
jgi:hypothetical protein